MPRSFYPQRNSPRHPLDSRLRGPQSPSGRYGEGAILYLTGTRTPTPRSSSRNHSLYQCFPTFLTPQTPCSECYFTAAPIKSKMEISCILHTYYKNELINHNFTTLNASSMTMQYCINGNFRMNMNISIRPNIMNLTLT
jgi:hypothetical protein